VSVWTIFCWLRIGWNLKVPYNTTVTFYAVFHILQEGIAGVLNLFSYVRRTFNPG